MKRTLSVIGQLLLFFITNVAGLFLHPFHLQSVLHSDSAMERSFAWDGLILMTLVYVLTLLLEVLLKRFRSSAPWSSLALVLAAAATYRLGFITHNW